MRLAEGGLDRVLRSETRTRVLESLAESPATLRELADRLDEPRTTTRDNLRRLVELGFVTEDTDRRYHATPAGKATAAGILSLENRLRTTRQLEPFLEHVPFERVPVERFDPATTDVVVPAATRPHAPTRRLLERVDDATTCRGVWPVAPPMFGRGPSWSPGPRPRDCSLVVSEAVYETVGPDPEQLSLAGDTVEVAVTGRTPPFVLCLLDDGILLEAVDEQGVPRALVETRAEDCIEWARETYELFRSEAVAVERRRATHNSP